MSTPDLDTTFLALADPTRRAILSRLVTSDATVMELAAPFDLSQPAISRHLKVLEQAGLVTRSREGTKRPVRAVVGPLKAATTWMDEYCRALEGNYQRLDGLLAVLQAPPKADDPIN